MEPQEWMWKRIGLYAFGALSFCVAGIVLGAMELGDSLLAKWALIAGIANVCQLCLVGSLVAAKRVPYWQSGCGFFAFVATGICLFLCGNGIAFLVYDDSASSALFWVSVCLDIVCFLSVIVMYSGWSYVQRE